MENCSFQAQLVSVVDILAKAALSEIHRRVDDSCAILRLEMSQSQRDIDTLKRKCQLMDGELKRTRIRLRRKGFNTMAVERYPSPIKMSLSKENKVKNVPVWAREMAVEELINNPPESTEDEPQAEIEPILIKDEAEEDLIGIREEFRVTEPDFGTKTGLTPLVDLPVCEGESSVHYNSTDNQEEQMSVLDSAGKYDQFTGQQLDGDQGDIDLMVKNEKDDESDQATILVGSDFGIDDRPLWPSNVGRDIPDLSYDTEQFQQSSFGFPDQCALQLVNNVTDSSGPQLHAVGKSNFSVVSTARIRRRSRPFGSKIKQPTVHITEHGQNSGGANAIGETSLISHVQDQYRVSEGGVSLNESLSGSNIVTPSLPTYTRTNFSLARRMRAHWRSGVGEKRFSCTYCSKSFMRFSQLKEHLRSHTGEKPFSCLQCGRSFTKQCNLIRHAVVHSGEKPYECGQCGKCFTQRSSMKSHQKTHVGTGDLSMHVVPSYGSDAHTSLMVPQSRCYK